MQRGLAGAEGRGAEAEEEKEQAESGGLHGGKRLSFAGEPAELNSIYSLHPPPQLGQTCAPNAGLIVDLHKELDPLL
jgi:hypothetical protein